MSPKVAIALVGCGGFSKAQCQPAIEKSGLFDVVACCDVRPDAADEAARRFGARRCDSLDQALALDRVEAVVLATPNEFHRPQAEAALAAGKHVFVEKPIANTVADGVAMVRAADAARRILMVGHNTRRRPAPRLALRYLNEGRIGTPLGCEANYGHAGGLHLPDDSWRADPARAPGLPLVQVGIHAVDVLNMLLGVPREVASFHRRAVLTRNVDCTVSIIAYDEPLTATLVSHYVAPVPVWFRVLGTAGALEARDGYSEFIFRPARGDPEVHRFAHDPSYVDEFAAFARAVRDGEPVETDGRSAVYALAVVEASILSARQRRFVRIDELVTGL